MPVFSYFIYIFFVFYTLVNLYVFSHFWHIRFRDKKRNSFRITFFFLTLLLPLHLVLERYLNISFLPLKFTAYFYFVTIFYSALYLLFMDALKYLLALLHLSKVFVRNYKHILSAGLFLAVVTTASGFYVAQQLHTVFYTAELEKRASDFDEIKIAVFSDLHLSDMSGKNFVRRIVDEVNRHDVDLVLIPGDIIDRHIADLRFDFASDFRMLKSRYGVFAVAGSQDYLEDSTRLRTFLEISGITYLEDSSVIIEGGLNVVGRRDRSYASNREGRKPLFEIMEKVDRNYPVILLDHTPFNIEQASEYDIGLQLSGHTHNGQLFPLQYIMKMIYHLSRGHRIVKGSNIIVSSGVGVFGPPVRTSAFPEIVLLTLRFR